MMWVWKNNVDQNLPPWSTIVFCHCFIFNIPFMHSTTLIWSISSQNRLVFCEAVASKKATNLMKPIQLCKKQTRKTNKNQSSNDPLVAGGWFKNNLLEGIKNFTRKTCINICAIKSSISHVAIDMCMICGCEIIGYLKLPYVHVFFFRP